jgi:hypothetical protein
MGIMAIGATRSSFSLDPTGLFRGLVAAKKEYDRRALRAIKLGALFYVAELKKELSKPGSGRLYKRRKQKGKGQFHRASVEGQPPAPDFGRLRASITHIIEKEFLSFVAQVGTNVEYAPHLEFGTKNMAARPFMIKTLARIRPQLIIIFQRALSG